MTSVEVVAGTEDPIEKTRRIWTSMVKNLSNHRVGKFPCGNSHTHTHARERVHIHTSTYTQIHVPTYTHTLKHTHASMYVHTLVPSKVRMTLTIKVISLIGTCSCVWTVDTRLQ